MASPRHVRHIAEYSLLRVASCAFSKEEDLSCHQILKGGLGFERNLPGFHTYTTCTSWSCGYVSDFPSTT